MSTGLSDTPRVTAGLIGEFGGATVRIVGKVKSLHGEHAILDAGGDVQVELMKTANFEVGRYYEVIGRVNEDKSVRMMQSSDWGTEINLTEINRAVGIIHKHPELFYESKA